MSESELIAQLEELHEFVSQPCAVQEASSKRMMSHAAGEAVKALRERARDYVRLQHDCDSLRRDAERYRWMRVQSPMMLAFLKADDLDGSVDAGMTNPRSPVQPE